jgi:glucokinase
MVGHLGVPTDLTGPNAVFDQMSSIVETLCLAADTTPERLIGVGIGIPGIVDHRSGLVVPCANVAGWSNLDVATPVAERIGNRNIFIGNDANNAALAEALIGAARGDSPVVMLTLGTGVGSGIVVDGKVWHGSRGGAGEIGHTVVVPGGRKCGCGQLGCLEAYASASSTAQRALERIRAGEASMLSDAVRDGQALTSESVVAAAAAGDELARNVWRETCRFLAIATVNVQHTIDPECIVLGGGMSAAGIQLLDVVQQESATLYHRHNTIPPQIRLAKLGNHAGFIGAALEVFARATSSGLRP